MPTVEFVGQSSQDGTAQPANTSRLLNLYREPVEEGGNTRHILRHAPGRELVADLGSAFLRAMAWVDSKVYTVSNGALYFVNADGAFTDLGEIDDDENTAMAGNLSDVTITANGKYYLYNGTTISQPTGAAFSNFGSVATVGNYTVLTEKGGNRIQWTDLGDPATFDALNFASTDGADNNNIRAVEIGGFLWVFKQRSIEVWAETGLANDEAFIRTNGGLLEKGLWGFNLVCKARESAFFVGTDGVGYLTGGGVPQPVSSRAVETAIRTKKPTHCSYYEQYGHKFCVIRFSDRPAWILDIATMEWHERAVGDLFEPWDVIDAVEVDSGEFWAGQSGGTISKFTTAATDLGNKLYRRAVSKTLRLDSERFRGKEFEVYGAYGYAAANADRLDVVSAGTAEALGYSTFYIGWGEDGNEPNLMASFSRDYGATFSAERLLPMGAQGEYQTRTVARQLGQYRQMTVQLDMTHGFDIPIYSDARLEVA